jgi:hypothetical protein
MEMLTQLCPQWQKGGAMMPVCTLFALLSPSPGRYILLNPIYSLFGLSGLCKRI